MYMTAWAMNGMHSESHQVNDAREGLAAIQRHAHRQQTPLCRVACERRAVLCVNHSCLHVTQWVEGDVARVLRVDLYVK